MSTKNSSEENVLNAHIERKISNENETLLYKNTKVIITLILVPILVAIIGPTLSFWFNPPPPDFIISVNPMNGQIQPNGVIQTTVTVAGTNGYKHTVSLSASDQPSGVVVSFTPQFGGAIPAYTSNVIINVGQNIQAGTYSIKIKGQGADGKEHSTDYTLYVMPATQSSILTPVPTPTPIPTSIPLPEIKITSPKDGDKVSYPTMVSGFHSGKLSEGQFMWVITSSESYPGKWAPKVGRINFVEGYEVPWQIEKVWLGEEKSDIGKKFEIAVVLVNKTDDEIFNNMMRDAEKGNFYTIRLPSSAKIKHQITVTRI